MAMTSFKFLNYRRMSKKQPKYIQYTYVSTQKFCQEFKFKIIRGQILVKMID